MPFRLLKKKTCEKKKRKKIDGAFKGDYSGYTYILSLFFFFWRETNTHTRESKGGSNTNIHNNSI